MKPKTRLLPDHRERHASTVREVAIHEAGHAAMAIILGDRIHWITINNGIMFVWNNVDMHLDVEVLDSGKFAWFFHANKRLDGSDDDMAELPKRWYEYLKEVAQ